MSEHNSQCWIRCAQEDPDKTTNIHLQYLCNEEDEELWAFMEDAAFQLVDRLTKSEPKEYWHRSTRTWATEKPDQEHIRVKGVVHESSSTFMGSEFEGGSVDDMYRPYGCKGVVSAAAIDWHRVKDRKCLLTSGTVCHWVRYFSNRGCLESNASYVRLCTGPSEETGVCHDE